MFDRKEYYKKYYKKNKENYSKNNKKWLEENSEHRKEYSKEYGKKWYEKNKENILANNKEWRKKNKKHILKYKKEYWKENKEYIKEHRNSLKYKANYNLWLRKKRKTDLKYSLSGKMGRAINISLKGNKAGRHWENLVGYKLADLIKHLKKTMPAGYNWQDFMQGKLHIDHIIPINVFNFTNPEHTDFKRCWDLNNLQLLPAKENRTKHNKLEKPFQPALKF